MVTRIDVWEDVAPVASRTLLPEHREILELNSGISPDIIDQRGYHSLTAQQITQLVHLEVIHAVALRATGWMAIPIWRPDKNKHGEVIRLFGAPTGHFKYIWPTGLRLALDVHPRSWRYLHDTSVDAMITEGMKKADAIVSAAEREGTPLLVIAANGCEGWKSKIEGSSLASPDFLDIILEDRKVYVNSDSDYRTNPRVSTGWNGCAAYLSSKTGEHRTFLVVTPPRGAEKQGADDFLASGKSLGDLLEQAQSPQHAFLDRATDRPPLKIKTGRKLMAEAGDKIPHLIAPLIPEQSITLVAGHSGTYKTWHMLGLALDGAFGFSWMGHPEIEAEHGPFSTLYVNKEMSGIILGQRLKILARNKRYTSVPGWEDVIDDRLHFIDDSSLDLSTEEQRERLEDAIVTTDARLVVLDSLSMCWHGDENSASEVGDFYDQMRGIIARTGCCIVPMHHLMKPPGGRPSKKAPPTTQFQIRGSGQLYQQADACILLQMYSTGSSLQSDEERLISLHHLKARTTREMPAWVSKFSDNDGMFGSMDYLCGLADVKAQDYAESGGNTDKLKEWIIEACLTMPAMLPGAGSPGFRSKQLHLMLQQAWTVPGKRPPNDTALHRQIETLVDEGRIVLLETSKKHGNLYRLAEEPDEDVEEIEPLAPPSGP